MDLKSMIEKSLRMPFASQGFASVRVPIDRIIIDSATVAAAGFVEGATDCVLRQGEDGLLRLSVRTPKQSSR